MAPRLRYILAPLALGILASCTRAPSESFASHGLRDARVVFIADTAEIEIKDISSRFKGIPVLRPGENPASALPLVAGKELVGWGSGCGGHFLPKAGSYDPRMGLTRQPDGWNVGSAGTMRNYVRTTGTDYLVVLNKVSLTRSELDRMGAGTQGRIVQGEAGLDLSVIDARAGKRVWRSVSQAKAERVDSLELLARDAVRQAADNFFTSLPESRRWGCPEALDRFH
ncbi:MAG: hypothetical protein H6686_10055 [Fibrobacteria bacterium]|nr:hypothetical protein [Fibrobacteria bacterium]